MDLKYDKPTWKVTCTFEGKVRRIFPFGKSKPTTGTSTVFSEYISTQTDTSTEEGTYFMPRILCKGTCLTTVSVISFSSIGWV